MNLIFKFKNVYAFILLILVSLISCKNDQKENKLTNNTSSQEADNVIEVTTNVMDFQMPSQIKSGWTTFKYNNKSEETHFFIFEKMPEGVTIQNYNNELVPPIKAGVTYLLNNKFEEGMKEFEKIPAWWAEVKMGGGVGLISPKSSAESTIYMHPGTYVMECYVRMPNGMAHAFYGMLKEVVVTEEKSSTKEPSSDYEINISSENGITFQDSIKTGEYQLAVRYKDQKKYESLLGHDVNLVRLDEISQLDSLSNWVDASDIKAFRTPAPQGLTFLGGVEDLEAGEVGYFKTKLEKGNYVLISEISNAIERKMFKAFKVY